MVLRVELLERSESLSPVALRNSATHTVYITDLAGLLSPSVTFTVRAIKPDHHL